MLIANFCGGASGSTTRTLCHPGVTGNFLGIGVFPINQKDWHDVGQWTEYSKTNDLFKK